MLFFYMMKKQKKPKPLQLMSLPPQSIPQSITSTSRSRNNRRSSNSNRRSNTSNTMNNKNNWRKKHILNIWCRVAFICAAVAASMRFPPTAAGLAVGGDATNANLTDLGSPAFIHGSQLIPNESQQIYELFNKVTLTDLQQQGAATSQEETSYTFQAQLKINSVWNSEQEQLLEVYFSDASVSAPKAKAAGAKRPLIATEQITKIPDRPFYISLVDGGKPSKVIAHTSRDQSLLNLERGIASLLQLRHESGPIKELDVSGNCNTFYTIKSSTRVQKMKSDCSHWDMKVNYRPEKPLSVAQHSQERIDYDLSSEGFLLKAESQEIHRMILESKPDVGSQVTSLLSLKHVAEGDADSVPQLKYATLEQVVKSLLEWYRVFDIEADVDGALTEIKHLNLKQEIVKQSDQLNNQYIGHASLAAVFADLLPLARITKQSEFVEILQEQKELWPQLVDLLGAVQTFEAHAAIHEVFQYDNRNDAELLEKYLQSLAVGSHPERAIVEHLFQQLHREGMENESLRDTVVQTVATLCRQSGFDVNDPLLVEIRAHLLHRLAAGCQEEDFDCKTLYIRSLQNLQDPSTISVLLQHALDGKNVKLSVAAMQALSSFPVVNFGEQQRRAFADIFYQRRRKYDSSARTIALDILLSLKPTKQQLGDMLDFLASHDRNFEVKTYVIQKLRMLASKCPRFRVLLGACLAERPAVCNYNVLAQKGLTTVLTRELSQTPAFNESLLSVQEIYRGVLKRGSVELLLSAGREETSTFKIGLYTSGLTYFTSDGEDDLDDFEEDEVEDPPTTAGMEISVQGALLRPLVFFRGQSEVMGHIWSGTASDPTPAYQATTLTQDHEHYVILASGATVYMRVLGAKSVNLNGRFELSLWNRNANTEILQNSGVAVLGHMIAGFTYAHVESTFQLLNEPSIGLQADIDFYSGVKLCMQLQRLDMILTCSNTKSVTLKAAKKPYTKAVHSKYSHKSPGRTLALNQKNNEMCKIILRA